MVNLLFYLDYIGKMSEILFEHELVRKVSQELGMEEKKVEHHLGFLKHFIKVVVEKDEIHSLQFPHLGTMYRNIKGAAHMNIYIEGRNLKEKHKTLFDKNKKDIKNILDKLSTFENKSLHNVKRRIHNPYFTTTKSREELEKFQNHGG